MTTALILLSAFALYMLCTLAIIGLVRNSTDRSGTDHSPSASREP